MEDLVVAVPLGGWGGCGGLGSAAGYLESLPVGPNHSDSVLLPGLLLQSPQLPASLFRGWAGTNKVREDERKRETLFLPEVSKRHVE